MINLQEKIKENYKLVWFDGEEISIPQPTQALLNQMVKLLSLGEEDTEELLITYFSLFKEVIKSNVSGRKFTDEELDAVPFNIVQMVMEDYANQVF